MSQQEVANKLKISQRSYSFYESGDRQPKISRLLQIGAVLKIEKAILLKTIDETLEPVVPQGTKSEEIAVLKANVKILMREVAKLRSHVTGRPFEEVLAELGQDTTALLQALGELSS